jgi:hypothetical protein
LSERPQYINGKQAYIHRVIIVIPFYSFIKVIAFLN